MHSTADVDISAASEKHRDARCDNISDSCAHGSLASSKVYGMLRTERAQQTTSHDRLHFSFFVDDQTSHSPSHVPSQQNAKRDLHAAGRLPNPGRRRLPARLTFQARRDKTHY